MNRIIRTALALTLAASTAPIAGMALAQQSTKPLEEQNGTTKKQPEANQSGSSSESTTEQNGSTTQKGSGTESSGEASGKAGTETQTQTKQQQQKSNDSATQQNGQSGTESTKSKNGAATQDNAQQKSGSDTKVSITTEQRTEIRSVIVKEKVEPVSVDVDVSVGVVIPKKVHLHRLPARIIKLVPAYRGYEFFILADGRIVIVEPSSYRVVYILTA